MRRAIPCFFAVATLGLACGGLGDTGAPPMPATEAPSTPGHTAPLAVDAGFDAAPPIRSDAWLNGDPVDVNAHDKLILVEMWGTWCGPCLPAGNHVQSIADAHPNDLTVVGVAQDDAPKAAAFLRSHRWTWRNATDPDGLILNAYGSSSVPHTYLIAKGRILWHGHPSEVDTVLTEVLAGRWTPAIATTYAELPRLVEQYLASPAAPDARDLGRRIVDGGRSRPSELNDLAWRILTEVPAAQRDLPLAVEASQLAVDVTHQEDYAILDTAALAQWEAGHKPEALALQQKAVAECDKVEGTDCGEIEGRLRQFGG
jgi:thiol-disulfide isomerase/thioredoxin